MKKAVCILLMMAIFLTCCTIGVSASCTISDELLEQMEAAKDKDIIRVNIWVNSIGMDENQLHHQAMTDAGFKIWEFDKLTSDQMSRYILARRSIESSLEQESCQRFIDSFGLDEEAIHYTVATCINADLTQAQIEEAAAHRLVNAVYFDSQNELPTEAPTEYSPLDGELYKARLKEFYQLDDFSSTPPYTDGLMTYRELYYHHDRDGEIDWALIYCFCNYCSPMEVTAIIGNRVVHSSDWQIPFQTGYGVYDVKNDRFYDAKSLQAVQLDGFSKVTDEINLTAEMAKMEGLIGDFDRDNDISIIDVTLIQRCEVKIRDYPEDDSFYVTDDFGKKARYYSDFNRDDERDVLDATCIQRYLAGLPYPIG